MQERTIQPGILGNVDSSGVLDGISDDTILYKYFSCETFCYFFNSPRLKFVNPTKWDDKFESRRYRFFQYAHRNVCTTKAEHYSATCWTLGAEDLICYGNDCAMHGAAINDLHEFGHAAMWGSFCRDGGVRIKSTYGKLKKLLIENLPPGEIWAGKVR